MNDFPEMDLPDSVPWFEPELSALYIFLSEWPNTDFDPGELPLRLEGLPTAAQWLLWLRAQEFTVGEIASQLELTLEEMISLQNEALRLLLRPLA